MKRSLLKTMLLLCALIVGGSAWAETYTKVTTPTSGKSYVVVAGNYAIKALSSTNNWVDGTDVSESISSDGNTLTTTATDIVWEMTSSNNKWKFKNGTNYLQNNSGNTYRNMTVGTTQSEYTISNSKIYSTGSTGKYLQYVPGSGFRMYDSDQTNASVTFAFYEKNEKTLSSLAISGTPTKTTYTEGESFDPAGLVVTATYTDATTADITSNATFTCTPSALTLGTTSVSVVASYNNISSSAHNVSVTVTEIAKYTVTIEAPSNGTLVIKNGDAEVTSGSKVANGTVLTAVPTPATGYKFRNWQAVDASTHTYTANYTYTVDGHDVTFKANFDAITYYTITWSVNGVETTEQVEENTAINFAAPTENIPTGYSFKGWYTSEYSSADTAPAYVYSANATANVKYYAVFAQGDQVEAWEKLSIDQVTEGGIYAIITGGGYAFNGTINSNGHGESTTSTFSFDSNNVAESAPNGTCELTLTVSGDGYTMYNAAHGYLYAKAASSGNLDWHQSETTYWMAYNEGWEYYKSYSGKYTYLRVYNNTFRTYNSKSNDPIYFAHKTTISSATDFRTSVPVPAITLSTNSVESTAADTDGTINVTYTAISSDPVIVWYTDATATTTTTTEPSWFAIDVDSDNNLSYLIEENTGAARTAYLKVYALDVNGEGVYSELITITQAAATFTVTINSACTDGTSYFGTYYTDVAYEMPEGVVGQTVTVANDVLTVTDAYTAGTIVPANTALLLKAETAGEKVVNLATGGTAPTGGNMLKGTLTANEQTVGENCLFYRLTMHDGKTIGFWWGAEDGAAFTPGANKAYLAVPSTAVNARMGFTFGGDATGIEAVSSKTAGNNLYFDLQGRRVMVPAKGLYIVNGKKVNIK